MADFPQYDWKILDNTTIPFTKPQHYKKGSTTEVELTGHDNPLPVGNYTKKGNLWLPVSEENPMPTQLTGSNVVLKEERNIAVDAKETLNLINRVNVLEFKKIIVIYRVLSTGRVDDLVLSFSYYGDLYGGSTWSESPEKEIDGERQRNRIELDVSGKFLTILVTNTSDIDMPSNIFVSYLVLGQR